MSYENIIEMRLIYKTSLFPASNNPSQTFTHHRVLSGTVYNAKAKQNNDLVNSQPLHETSI